LEFPEDADGEGEDYYVGDDIACIFIIPPLSVPVRNICLRFTLRLMLSSLTSCVGIPLWELWDTDGFDRWVPEAGDGIADEDAA
jgi:hypothetical protein